MIRKFKRGLVRGVGIIPYALSSGSGAIVTREVFNISWQRNRSFGLGATMEFSADTPVHVGVVLGKLIVYIQLFAVQEF